MFLARVWQNNVGGVTATSRLLALSFNSLAESLCSPKQNIHVPSTHKFI